MKQALKLDNIPVLNLLHEFYDWINTWHTLELRENGPGHFRITFKGAKSS